MHEGGTYAWGYAIHCTPTPPRQVRSLSRALGPAGSLLQHHTQQVESPAPALSQAVKPAWGEGTLTTGRSCSDSVLECKYSSHMLQKRVCTKPDV